MVNKLVAARKDYEARKNKAAEIRDLLVEYGMDQSKKDQGVLNRRLATAGARDMVVLEELEKSLKLVFKSGWLKPQTYKGKKKKHHERILNIFLSDLHFQSLLDPREVPKKYGPHEEARRLGCIAAQVADYKRQYRPETKLHIYLAGDIIQGILHDPREAAPMTLQVAAAVRYILAFILFLAAEFPNIEIWCTPGNHGRNKQRHPERAVFQKFDAFETTIYDSVRIALEQAKLPNVKFNIGLRPYFVVDLFNDKLFVTHGDTVFKTSHPSNSVNVKEITHKILKWNAAKNVEGPFSLFAIGHHHIPLFMAGNPGLIINGCLVPSDSFALSIDSPDVSCGQQMWESVEGKPMGDSRFISVDDADDEESYEVIIKPFISL